MGLLARHIAWRPLLEILDSQDGAHVGEHCVPVTRKMTETDGQLQNAGAHAGLFEVFVPLRGKTRMWGSPAPQALCGRDSPENLRHRGQTLEPPELPHAEVKDRLVGLRERRDTISERVSHHQQGPGD